VNFKGEIKDLDRKTMKQPFESPMGQNGSSGGEEKPEERGGRRVRDFSLYIGGQKPGVEERSQWGFEESSQIIREEERTSLELELWVPENWAGNCGRKLPSGRFANTLRGRGRLQKDRDSCGDLRVRFTCPKGLRIPISMNAHLSKKKWLGKGGFGIKAIRKNETN